MKIVNRFPVTLPPDEAYALLLDLERVAPCFPGATLLGARDDGAQELQVAVKLGPMRFVYAGTVRISERDPAARRAVLQGSASEARGQGSAQATVTMTVAGNGSGTSHVETLAEIELTGRAAQMGHGVVQSVAQRLIADMARCLEGMVGGDGAPGRSGEPRAETDAAAPERTPPPVKAGSLLWSVLLGKVRSIFRRRRRARR